MAEESNTAHPSSEAGSAQAAPEGEAGGSPMGEAGGVLGQAVFDLARVLLRRGRVEARKAASTGRLRLDLRQLQKDRDAMYNKLGRELRHLVEGGELDHPGLKRGVERIGELDQRIEDLKRELALAGEPVVDPPTAEPTAEPAAAGTAAGD